MTIKARKPDELLLEAMKCGRGLSLRTIKKRKLDELLLALEDDLNKKNDRPIHDLRTIMCDAMMTAVVGEVDRRRIRRIKKRDYQRTSTSTTSI
jgi:hypothetical protein